MITQKMLADAHSNTHAFHVGLAVDTDNVASIDNATTKGWISHSVVNDTYVQITAKCDFWIYSELLAMYCITDSHYFKFLGTLPIKSGSTFKIKADPDDIDGVTAASELKKHMLVFRYYTANHIYLNYDNFDEYGHHDQYFEYLSENTELKYRALKDFVILNNAYNYYLLFRRQGKMYKYIGFTTACWCAFPLNSIWSEISEDALTYEQALSAGFFSVQSNITTNNGPGVLLKILRDIWIDYVMLPTEFGMPVANNPGHQCGPIPLVKGQTLRILSPETQFNSRFRCYL